MTDFLKLKSNFENFIDRVDKTCDKCGVDYRSVTIVPAVKSVEPLEIDNLYELGIKAVGENKVQELLEKYQQVTKPFEWHFIGQLQSNKVKYIIDKVKLIHSLDRLSLAQEIQRQAAARNIIKDCLIEINCSGLETRGGVSFLELPDFIETIKSNYPNINILGLMTVLPDNETSAKAAEKMGGLFQKYKKDYQLKYLSMGMTDDFETALKNGANLLRPGRILFGERVYK